MPVIYRLAAIALMLLLFATATAKSDAKVLARGMTVDERPVTVIAIASAYKPSRVALDVADPSAEVHVEWSVLCFGSPGPTTGGEFDTDRPAHRRLELPPRPRGLCHVETEARFVDPAQTGHIALTLRGHVKRPPV